MKIGDLVKLSAYGRARKQNKGCEYGYGLIIRKEIGRWDKYPFKCLWYNLNGNDTEQECAFHPRELKKYKRT